MSAREELPRLRVTLRLPQYTLGELLSLIVVVTAVTGFVRWHFRAFIEQEEGAALIVGSLSACSAALGIVGARIAMWIGEERGYAGRQRLLFLLAGMVAANIAGSYLFYVAAAVAGSYRGAGALWGVLGCAVMCTFLRFETVIPQIEIRLTGSSGVEKGPALRAICEELIGSDAAPEPSPKLVYEVQRRLGERGLHASADDVVTAWRSVAGDSDGHNPGARPAGSD